jgi:Rhodanese-like domain
MFKAMRNTLIAVALIAVTANAQYKTPSTPPPTQPGAVQVAPNNNIQVTTATNPDDELTKARRINRAEAMKLVKEKKAVWIDVRGKDAYDQSHIPGAISIPLGELNDNLTKLPPRKFLITYCA